MKKSERKKTYVEIDPSIVGISRATIEEIISAWHESGNEPPIIRKDLPDEDVELLKSHINHSIRETGGHMSRQAKVIHLAMVYINLSKAGKEKFLRILARDYDVDLDLLDKRIHELQDASEEEARIQAELALRDSLVPPRVKLLNQLINLPNGFIFLKDMRKDLLPAVKSIPRLKKLDGDIRNLLITYFDVNLLDLREITWDTSAATLERLMGYEAVHEINSWLELKYRLFSDHRMYGFFHNKMPNDPLIFIEVALVKGMSDNIQKLIDVNMEPGNPYEADTAIFYSISSTQQGLKGISFGDFLIKRVVKKISQEFRNIKKYATLSPIPSFRPWLTDYLQHNCKTLLKRDEKAALVEYTGIKNPGEAILSVLNTENWHTDPQRAELLKDPLMRLCTHYLINIKKPGTFMPMDPVSKFHLSNGARIQHIHWLADTSSRGMRQSAGIMLNYYYKLDEIVMNHENFMTSGKIISSKYARGWLK